MSVKTLSGPNTVGPATEVGDSCDILNPCTWKTARCSHTQELYYIVDISNGLTIKYQNYINAWIALYMNSNMMKGMPERTECTAQLIQYLCRTLLCLAYMFIIIILLLLICLYN